MQRNHHLRFEASTFLSSSLQKCQYHSHLPSNDYQVPAPLRTLAAWRNHPSHHHRHPNSLPTSASSPRSEPPPSAPPASLFPRTVSSLFLFLFLFLSRRPLEVHRALWHRCHLVGGAGTKCSDSPSTGKSSNSSSSPSAVVFCSGFLSSGVCSSTGLGSGDAIFEARLFGRAVGGFLFDELSWGRMGCGW